MYSQSIIEASWRGGKDRSVCSVHMRASKDPEKELPMPSRVHIRPPPPQSIIIADGILEKGRRIEHRRASRCTCVAVVVFSGHQR